jgi:hypothetical protein
MAADVFVYLDTVQFSKNGLQNRNQIKTAQGASWLTVPVKHHFGQKLNEIELADSGCTHKHWKTLQANYARTSGFNRWKTEIEQLLAIEYSLLVEVAIASTEWMLEKLKTETHRIKASDLNHIDGTASELVSSICCALKADCYLTGTGGLVYLDCKDFAAFDCQIQVQSWKPFEYKQAFPTKGFVSDLSTLDLLLNCPDSAENLILEAGGWEPLLTTQ